MADLNDFQKPDLTSAYSSEVLQTIQGNIARVAKMDPETAANVPVGFVKFSEGNFYKWDGASWIIQPLLANQNTGDITYSAISSSAKDVTTPWGSYNISSVSNGSLPTVYLSGNLTKICIDGQFTNIIGTRSVDSVYVKSGTKIDLTALGSAGDIVYLTGSWSSYTKTYGSETLTFTRAINGQYEVVKVSAMAGTNYNDKIVFSDGSIGSNDARLALVANPNCTLASITGYDAATKTPSTPDSSFTLISSPIQSSKLFANGQIVSRANYSGLFAKIGTTFGAGDGVTTFQLPTIADLTPNVKAFISI